MQIILSTGAIGFYLGIGAALAVASIRTWQTGDSIRWQERAQEQDTGFWVAFFLFPWNTHDRCVGPACGFSVCGEAIRHGGKWIALYIALMCLAWPVKLAWSFATWIYSRFII